MTLSRYAHCPFCGRRFERGIHHWKVYCSPRCQQAHWRDKNKGHRRQTVSGEPATCEGCGAQFTPARPHSRYCSDRCRKASWAKRARPPKEIVATS